MTSVRLNEPARFPSVGLGLVIRLYELLWHLFLPLLVLNFWRRGAREPMYRQFWGERFGRVQCQLSHAIWVHCASMGEMRGAAPWIKQLLSEGFAVYLTTLTPAGRHSAVSLFKDAMQKGQMQLSYAPLELSWAVRSFLKRVRPRCAVMTEIDTWPVLLATIRRAGIPLAFANAQYPAQSFERDRRWGAFRARLFKAYELVMCKSALQARRFDAVGCTRVEVVGETRFDLPVSEEHRRAAGQLRASAGVVHRPAVCFASAIEGEDDLLIEAMRRMQSLLAQSGQPMPFFVYVPRSPQRFDAVARLIEAAGLRMIRRSQQFDAALYPHQKMDWQAVDVLLGDSIGEMYFYLELSQLVVVGSSFGTRAVHNIIEPLAINKPVWTGPSMRGIEYPAMEAMEAGVLHHARDAEDLAQQLAAVFTTPGAYEELVDKTRHFNTNHAGSVTRHQAVFLPWLQQRRAA